MKTILILLLLCSTAHAGMDFTQLSKVDLPEFRGITDAIRYGVKHEGSEKHAKALWWEYYKLKAEWDMYANFAKRDYKKMQEINDKMYLIKAARDFASVGTEYEERNVGATGHSYSRGLTKQELEEWRR